MATRMVRLAAIAVMLLGIGCGNRYDEQSGGTAPERLAYDQTAPLGEGNTKDAPGAVPPQTAPSPGAPEQPLPLQRQIIRTGEISIRVHSLDSAERALTHLAITKGGYTSNSSRNRVEGNTLSGTLELRLPSAAFDSVLNEVRRLGEMQSESIHSTDVTEEYIDLNARLATQQQLEERLVKLLQERSGKLSDIIEIEEKLAQIRKEIESIQGRLRYLQNQVGYSTLTVTMYEPGAVGTSQTRTVGGRLSGAWDRGIEGLVELIGVIITLFIALLPIIALAVVLFFLLRPWLRRRKLRREAKARGTTPV